MNDAEVEDDLASDDVVILPEVHLARLLRRARRWRCRKVLHNQGGFIALRNRPRRRIDSLGIEFAIGTVPYVRAITHEFLGVPRDRIIAVPNWVVRGPFADDHSDDVRRKLAVCCMPRKRREDVIAIHRQVRSLHPDVGWVEIDGLSEIEVARVLRENAVFLSTQDEESFGLPAIEAMALGCLVAGYAGTGAFTHPYATADNGLWVTDRSSADAAQAVCRLIHLCKLGDAEVQRLREAGIGTARRFGQAEFRSGVQRLAHALRTGQVIDALAEELAPAERLAALEVLRKSHRLRLTEWLDEFHLRRQLRLQQGLQDKKPATQHHG